MEANKKKNVCLIPARGGSMRFPNKNKLLLGNAIDKVKACKMIDEVWVSTDDEELAEIAKKHGALFIERPEHLAVDTATTEEAMLHFAYNVPFDNILLFECTFPLTTVEDVSAFVKLFLYKNNASVFNIEYSLISMKRTKDFIWKVRRGDMRPPYAYGCSPRTQDFCGTLVECGGLYMTTRKRLVEDKARVSGLVDYYEVSPNSVEVDTELDYKIAELIKNEK